LLEEIAREIESVTNDQVIELASSCFKPDRMGLVLLGDLKGRELGSEVFEPLASL
jgi:predicted Zn-dependent peptidase